MSRNQGALFWVGLCITVSAAALVVLTIVRLASGDVTDGSVEVGLVALLDGAAGVALLWASRRSAKK